MEACRFGYQAALDLDDEPMAGAFARRGLQCAMICPSTEDLRGLR